MQAESIDIETYQAKFKFLGLGPTLCVDLAVGRWPTINFSQYGICSSMVENSLPEDIHSTLALSYIMSGLR